MTYKDFLLQIWWNEIWVSAAYHASSGFLFYLPPQQIICFHFIYLSNLHYLQPTETQGLIYIRHLFHNKTATIQLHTVTVSSLGSSSATLWTSTFMNLHWALLCFLLPGGSILCPVYPLTLLCTCLFPPVSFSFTHIYSVFHSSSLQRIPSAIPALFHPPTLTHSNVCKHLA